MVAEAPDEDRGVRLHGQVPSSMRWEGKGLRVMSKILAQL